MSAIETVLRFELECPVCNEYMHTIIPVCVNGHSVCNSCKQKCANCPLCKCIFGGGRNYSLEHMAAAIKYPCKNMDKGCHIETSLVEMLKHVEECEFRDLTCPLEENGNCGWIGQLSELKEHIYKKHSGLNSNYSHTNINNSSAIIYACKRPFRVIRRYTPSTGLVNWVVQYIGAKSKGSSYIFKVEFSDLNKSGLELSMSAVCMPMCERKNVFDNVGITIRADMLQCYKTGSQYKHKLTIMKRN
ncbi:seven in absentia [Carabus blaptoides fortunei]